MKIVIDISPLTHQYIEKGYRTADVAEELFTAVQKGTPLPKGHGRLGDLDAICKDIIENLGIRNETFLLETEEAVYKRIKNADTIIAADKEYEAKVITRGNCMMCGKELTEGLFLCKECEAKATQGRK